MKTVEVLSKLADVTATQWGMVTTAQAGALGVARLTLSRLDDSGHFERLAHGVYKDAGVPQDEFEDLHAAWLSTNPGQLAEERVNNLFGEVVVAGVSAAFLHRIGDFWASRHEFISEKRRQTQRSEIRYRQRIVAREDITLVEGLPVLRIERTLTDLLEEVGDMSLVADALGDAMKQQELDYQRLGELFNPLAERNGFRRHDGDAVVERLIEMAGLDAESKAQRIARDPVLGARVFANYVKNVLPDLSVIAPEVSQQALQIVRTAIGSHMDVEKILAQVSEIADTPGKSAHKQLRDARADEGLSA